MLLIASSLQIVFQLERGVLKALSRSYIWSCSFTFTYWTKKWSIRTVNGIGKLVCIGEQLDLETAFKEIMCRAQYITVNLLCCAPLTKIRGPSRYGLMRFSYIFRGPGARALGPAVVHWYVVPIALL